MEQRENKKKNEHQRRQLGIRGKMLSVFVPAVIIVIAIITFLIYHNTSKIILEKSEEVLVTTTQSVVNDIDTWKTEVITALDQERDALEYFPMDKAGELEYIKHTAEQYDAFPAGIYVANTNDGSLEHASFVPGPEFNIFEKPWYKEGIASEEFLMGSVYYDEDSKNYVVGASGMLKDQSGNVRGVAAADIYLNAISSIVKDVKLEDTGKVFIVDLNTNTIIGSEDDKLMGTLLSDQKNGIYQYAEKQLEADTEGLKTYEAEGGDVYLDFAKVPGTNWAAVAYVPSAEIMKDLNKVAKITIAVAVLAVLILSLVLALLMRNVITHPIRQIDKVAVQIANGKLDEEISYRSNDELGKLVLNFNLTVERLRDYVNYINEVSTVLRRLADGILKVELTYDYAGEFAKVKDSLILISDSLRVTIGKINEASGQVSIGSDQISASSQTLSQGATEQASSVEQLAATITEISGQIRHNADRANDARLDSERTSEEISTNSQKIHDMKEAMDGINQKSSEISKIIKTIEDIAFQTNILALNAAVEAARAGEAGKGFAVVADEVRNLAAKSADAAKDTTQLIEDTVRAVENGTVIAEDASQSMVTVVEKAAQIAEAIRDIAEISDSQSQAIAQVTVGMDQISSVVQTNSATAEESAAASEELSAQAQALNELVQKFRL